jgi:hypothetical protein
MTRRAAHRFAPIEWCRHKCTEPRLSAEAVGLDSIARNKQLDTHGRKTGLDRLRFSEAAPDLEIDIGTCYSVVRITPPYLSSCNAKVSSESDSQQALWGFHKQCAANHCRIVPVALGRLVISTRTRS